MRRLIFGAGKPKAAPRIAAGDLCMAFATGESDTPFLATCVDYSQGKCTLFDDGSTVEVPRRSTKTREGKPILMPVEREVGACLPKAVELRNVQA